MVFQIKHRGKPRAGKVRLVPGARLSLGLQQISNSANDGLGPKVVAGEKAEQSPRRLAGRAGSGAFEVRSVVGFAALSPASVVVLAGADPFGSTHAERFAHVETDRGQSTQDKTGAVDVVH